VGHEAQSQEQGEQAGQDKARDDQGPEGGRGAGG